MVFKIFLDFNKIYDFVWFSVFYFLFFLGGIFVMIFCLDKFKLEFLRESIFFWLYYFWSVGNLSCVILSKLFSIFRFWFLYL